MNNNSVYIDSQKLTSAISDFRSVNTKIKDLFDKVDKETIFLKDYWDTMTSESVFNDMNNLSNVFKDKEEIGQEYADFLQNVVDASYINYENTTNKVIDEQI